MIGRRILLLIWVVVVLATVGCGEQFRRRERPTSFPTPQPLTWDWRTPTSPIDPNETDPRHEHDPVSVAFANGHFVAAGWQRANGALYQSVDGGATWDRISFPAGSAGRPTTSPDELTSPNALAYGDGRWVAANAGQTETSEDDGSTWRVHPGMPWQRLGGLAYGNGRFVGVDLEGIAYRSGTRVVGVQRDRSGIPTSRHLVRRRSIRRSRRPRNHPDIA